jgi:hypothetical protein
MTRLDIHHCAQHIAGYCLPACVQMVLAYLGRSVSVAVYSTDQDDLAMRMGVKPFVGAPYSAIKRLISPGVHVVYARQGNLPTLRDALNHSLPVILFVQAGELAYWQGHKSQHAIVMIGWDGATQTAYVLDPAMPPAPLTVPLGDLMLAWDEMDNAYAVISLR